jgi:hypothetical protein
LIAIPVTAANGTKIALDLWVKPACNKEITTGSAYIMRSYVSRLTYEINSIRVEPNKREYTIIGSDKVQIPNVYLSVREFIEKIRELRMKELDIFKQLRSCIVMAESLEKRDWNQLSY